MSTAPNVGTVCIQSKTFPRQPGSFGALPPLDGPVVIVDVTSGQKETNANRRAFSPMHMEANVFYNAPDGHNYGCFEHYWQSLKHFPDRPHAVDKTWWRNQTRPRRRLPGVAPGSCTHAADESRFPGQTFDYVASRKRFYLKDYRNLIRTTQRARLRMQQIRTLYQNGGNIVVRDYDGPRTADGATAASEVTVELLREKLHDTTHPFGHGYIVAAEILGIEDAAFETPTPPPPAA